jgi:hypothetical protein
MALNELWESVKAWVNQPGEHQLRVAIPVDRTDLGAPPDPLVPHASYFRLWLSEMFLSRQSSWFVDLQPMVHSIVKLKFADRDGVSLASVMQPPPAPANTTILLNYKMTELLPYNGGTIEIEAVLSALKTGNGLEPAIKILQLFSGMVTVPLAPVLGVAEKLATGVQDVVAASQGSTHLAIHDSLRTGGPQGLAPGYIAVIRATADDVAAERLSVKESRMYYAPLAGAKAIPFDLYDYMLVFIETMKTRDDWRLKTIQEPLDEAIKSFVAGEKDRADAYRKVALTVALTSPDLTVADRNRAAIAVRDELKALENLGLGAAPPDRRSLAELVDVHTPNPALIPTKPLSFNELMRN